MESEDKRAQYMAVFEALVDHYGCPERDPAKYPPPMDELIITILSQATSDINRDMGYRGLRERFDSWQQVMDAPVEKVAEAIYSAGLANQKSARIQSVLQTVNELRGAFDLGFLAEMPLDEARRWLTSMKGVGRKTASIVLLFGFGRPTFPVDTHVHRILKRLGIIGPKVTADKAHELVENTGDANTFYPMHLNMIRLGREICQARQPKCAICPLQAHCLYYQTRQDA